MTKRPKRARYTCEAYAGPNGFVRRVDHTGTSTFDAIWRQAPAASSHIVMRFAPGRYLVTDRFTSLLLPDARVAIGPAVEFEDLDTAMMAAIMMAGQESKREEFARLCMLKFMETKGLSRRAIRFSGLCATLWPMSHTV